MKSFHAFHTGVKMTTMMMMTMKKKKKKKKKEMTQRRMRTTRSCYWGPFRNLCRFVVSHHAKEQRQKNKEKDEKRRDGDLSWCRAIEDRV